MRKPSVHVRDKHQHLFYDFRWQGVRCREFIGLLNTSENRTRCQKMARLMTQEMELRTFDYLRHFPNGSRKHLFTGRPENKVTFEWFAENVWLPHIRTKGRAETAEDYHDILTVSVYPRLGQIALKDFRPEHCDQYINYLIKDYRWHRSLPIGAHEIEGRPLSPRRINIILLRLRQVLDLAFERKYLDDNPHEWISLQEETLPDIDPFSFEEQATFLETLRSQFHPNREPVNYFTVALLTGLSPSEQTALRWDYVDWKANTLLIRRGLVRGKSTNLKTKHRRRDVTMLPLVREAMEDQYQMAQAAIGSPYVFPNSTGKPLDLANIRHRWWYPILQKAGLRPRDLYQCRHTFASLMLQSGEDPTWIARMMGHSNTKMLFERYARWIRNRTRQDGSAYMEALKGVKL